ncbi:ThiF family adenylyltransferase [Leifsonia shinshuensis]|uniref:ThiF family adenylyltransferase n=1 Tax=Leifsonia shinshuensis TaxID=150026 RepID=UPI002861FDE7|nr:ThiF family adenylyltransferase [Leifsonia shinshuensis]MDR6969987.1 adenylyltransferase/sulfurtransferase [Leifsonia shinshuensis]
MALPPLVEPGPDLTPDRVARYARTTQLPGFGTDAQRRVRAARVLVVGAGGLGSAVLPLLASSGFGTIGIVDDDRVEPSNLPRQNIHTPADVGRPKVESAADTVRALGDEVEVRIFAERLSADNAERILSGFDLVLDGSDNFPTRYLVDDAATLAGIPVVWGAVHQTGGQVGLSWSAQGPTYRDLFPVPPAPGTVASCAEAGALPSECGVVGALMVGEAVKLVTGTGTPLLGRVVLHDALSGGFRELAYERDPEGPPVTGLIDYDLFCGITDTISPAELDARLRAGEAYTLLDVREPWEADIVELPGSLLVPLGVVQRDPAGVAERLPGDPLVIVCHHGIRAETARVLLAEAGLPGLVLAGGLDAWSRDVDPSLPRY